MAVGSRPGPGCLKPRACPSLGSWCGDPLRIIPETSLPRLSSDVCFVQQQIQGETLSKHPGFGLWTQLHLMNFCFQSKQPLPVSWPHGRCESQLSLQSVPFLLLPSCLLPRASVPVTGLPVGVTVKHTQVVQGETVGLNPEPSHSVSALHCTCTQVS